MAAPLIVTGELPAALQTRAETLRRAHYPPERNAVAAHVTLFHALPPFVEEEARALLAALASALPPPEARLAQVMDLGTGTAFRIESAELLEVRDHIAEHFHGMLTQQDRPRPRLHVTVQNKVERAEARALQAELAIGFRPETFRFAGLALHRYLGGPWEPAGRWTFRGHAKSRR
jgi:2'-5' RNA ligase superfamily